MQGVWGVFLPLLFVRLFPDTSKWIKMADIDIRSADDLWCDRLPISFEYFQMSSVSGMSTNSFISN